MDAKARGIQALTDLYSDPTVRQARMDELGESGLEALGKLALRQDDYSRSMNELGTQRTALAAKEAEVAAWHGELQSWFDQKNADLTELETLRQKIAKPNGNPNPNPGNPNPNPGAPNPDSAAPAPNANFLTKDAFDRALAETERGAVAFFNDLNQLSLQHFQQFGEILDTQQLLTDKRVQQLGLRGVYADRFKPQLDERAAKVRLEAEEKIRADERQKIQAAQASQHHPYPIRGNEPSTLDALEQARNPQGQPARSKTVDELVSEYARLSSTPAS